MRRGTLIAGRYALRAGLGAGGMGEVWEAYDQRLDRRVAIKVIRRSHLPPGTDHDKLVRRFTREAKVTARLEHPGVPPVYDLGTHEGEPYLVMRLVSGTNLADLRAEQGGLPVAWVAAIGAQVCSVLAAAHDAALVHRDLKPRNVMLRPGGTITVLDFGIAAVLDEVDLAKLTTTGHPLGTATYMAPEQLSGEPVGPATDLYALGCVLHELLADQEPFGTGQAAFAGHLNKPPPPLRSLRPDVPSGLEQLVLRLLAKRPAERPADAAEVYRRLARLVAGAAASGTGPAAADDPTLPFHVPFGPLPAAHATVADTLPLHRRPGRVERSP